VEARGLFGPDLESAAAARHFTERQLAAWGLLDLLDRARLLISELVVNAVSHAASPTEVVLRTDGRSLRVEVSDNSRALPRTSCPLPGAPSGRGLLIVGAVADRWGVCPHPQGKIVWCELGPEAALARRHPGWGACS
jgi:anti-sigma regulatory factor (Ser/Thr protein kinase)